MIPGILLSGTKVKDNSKVKCLFRGGSPPMVMKASQLDAILFNLQLEQTLIFNKSFQFITDNNFTNSRRCAGED